MGVFTPAAERSGSLAMRFALTRPFPSCGHEPDVVSGKLCDQAIPDMFDWYIVIDQADLPD